MDTKELLNIIKLRAELAKDNPTADTVAKEVIKALERLIQYEKKSA